MTAISRSNKRKPTLAGAGASGAAGLAGAKAEAKPAAKAAKAEAKAKVDPKATRAARQKATGVEGAARAKLEGKLEGAGASGLQRPAPVDLTAPGIRMAMPISAGGTDSDQQRIEERPQIINSEKTVSNGEKIDRIHAEQDQKIRDDNNELLQNIYKLQPGEKLVRTSKGELNGKVPRLKDTKVGIEHEVKTTVEKTPGGYKVTAENGLEGQVGVGVKTGGGQGPGAKVEVAAGGNSAAEYEFSNAKDAERGAYILGRGGPENQADRDFLDQHRVSEESASKVSISGNVTVGSKPPGIKLKGGFTAKGEAQDFVKLNYKKDANGNVVRGPDGKPVIDSVEYGTRTKGELGAKGQIEAEGPEGTSVSIDTGGKANVEVEIEQKTVVKVPPGVDQEQLRNDPLGTLEKHPPDPDFTSSETKITTKGNTQVLAPDGQTVTATGGTETVVRGNQPEKNPDGTAAERKPTVSTTATSTTSAGEAENIGIDLVVIDFEIESTTDKVSKPTSSKVESGDYGDLTG